MRLIALLLASALIEFTYSAYVHAPIHTLPAAKARALPIRAVATNPIYDVEPEQLEEPHQEAIERLDVGSMQGVVVPTALPKPSQQLPSSAFGSACKTSSHRRSRCSSALAEPTSSARSPYPCARCPSFIHSSRMVSTRRLCLHLLASPFPANTLERER